MVYGEHAVVLTGHDRVERPIRTPPAANNAAGPTFVEILVHDHTTARERPSFLGTPVDRLRNGLQVIAD